MTTLAGDGVAASNPDFITPVQLNDPKKIFLYGGNLYYAEYEKIRNMHNMQPTSIETIAGNTYGSTIGVSALSSQVKEPQGLYFYSDNKYLIADTGNHRILKVENSVVSFIAGSSSQGYSTGYAIGSQLSSPNGVVALGSSVVFTDTGNHCIRKINTDGTLTTIAGVCTTSGYNSDQADATNAWLSSPSGIVEVNGDLYFTDSMNGIIRKLEAYCDTGYVSYDNYQCTLATVVPQCFGISASDSSVCSGRGSCTSYNNCVCNSTYYGSQCSYDYSCGGLSPDSSTACNGKGVCQSQDKCQCISGIVGNLCNLEANCFGIYSYTSTVCSANGNCIGTNVCSCNKGYYGSQCSYNYACNGIAPDSSNVCNSRGSCNSNGTCSCVSGYQGSYCESAQSTHVVSSDTGIWIGIGLAIGVSVLFLVVISVGLLIIVITLRLRKKKHNEARRIDQLRKDNDEQARIQSNKEKPQEMINLTITTNSNSSGVNAIANTSTNQPSSSSTNTQIQPSSTMGSYTSYLNSNSNQNTELSYAILNQGEDNSFRPPPTIIKQASKTNDGMDIFSSKDHTYKIIKVLGRGGFGTCYLCADVESNDLIAVKAIPTNLNDFSSIFSEFSKCLAFQHPNLVRSYEYLQGNGMMCLAMKFYKCGDLEHIFRNVAKRKPPSDELLISIINQVGEGLDYLHRTQKVLHRDIKPNNIMVDEFDEDNSKISVAIGDFGVSKQATTAHTFTGTIYYVSPELYAGSKDTSYPTDIFSFGVTMYLIICNHFNNMRQGITQLSMVEGYDKVMDKVRKELNATGIKDDITELVMKMLSKEPGERPLAEELANFCKINVC
ncbi:predicted protein [Naegleria gruberi]|uniref:mitogen-activated protein kinase kinase n=1 Tax=Naegleria gruberi TaxID=5762 RepID=D2VLP5_NAEGR|nr:uncharacterized protein NAEGRDRAFT_50593 [Naegleria gruberi]EFC42096.1 predicted protein [Naegleria gruberi]|eukprot:XP_002674840.1 predicted protein [Naegleria gruberi strain NEG-M]